MAEQQLSELIPRFDLRGMDLQLERMRHALQDLGSPCGEIPAIQVAGTNGKGSIASFLSAALQQAGIRSGVTTSPHLVSWCERIAIDGVPISEGDLRQLLLAQQQLCAKHRLTPFEQLLAAALAHFHTEAVELLVLEVGLGGRLDATTAHPCRPVIAMASIGLDHCEHLGSTLTAIAEEKAAVITPGAQVISAEQPASVREVLEKTCSANNAVLRWVDPVPSDWCLGLGGDWQRRNAAVAHGALQALHPLGWRLDEPAIRAGLAKARWKGRLQTVTWQGHPLLLDGAHNPPAAQQLALERQSWQGQDNGVVWILGIQAHKQAVKMLQLLLQPQDQAWIVPVSNHRSWTRDALLQTMPHWKDQLIDADSPEDALKRIEETRDWPQPMPVLAGSLYLIGDLLERRLVQAE